MTINELKFEVRIGDKANGSEITKVKNTLVETVDGKLCFSESRYPRITEVSRDGSIYYKLSPQGGKRS